MVKEAVKELDSRKGVSSQAIRNSIKVKYPTMDLVRLKYTVRKALIKGLENGSLVRPANSTATGAQGRFRVGRGVSYGCPQDVSLAVALTSFSADLWKRSPVRWLLHVSSQTLLHRSGERVMGKTYPLVQSSPNNNNTTLKTYHYLCRRSNAWPNAGWIASLPLFDDLYLRWVLATRTVTFLNINLLTASLTEYIKWWKVHLLNYCTKLKWTIQHSIK